MYVAKMCTIIPIIIAKTERSSAGPHSNHSNINHTPTHLVYVLFSI